MSTESRAVATILAAKHILIDAGLHPSQDAIMLMAMYLPMSEKIDEGYRASVIAILKEAAGIAANFGDVTLGGMPPSAETIIRIGAMINQSKQYSVSRV